MPVITISRQLGSLGTQIARLLSENLNCKFLDKDTMEDKFEEFGLPLESVEKYDERKPGFWDIFKTDRARYLHFLKGIHYDFARQGSCIILGRGGQVILGELPGILNVRVIAPMEIRIQRVSLQFECDARHAEKIIQQNDHERAGFHKFFFDHNWEDLSLYDLVVNTGFFTPESAAKLIKDASKMNELKNAQKETKARLTDLCMEHDVKTAIAIHEKIGVQFLEVMVQDGVVTLRGIVADEADVEKCREVAQAIDKVKEIKNEIYYKPITTSYGLHY